MKLKLWEHLKKYKTDMLSLQGGMRAVQWASSAHVLVSAAALAAVVALGSTLHTATGDVNAWEVLAKEKPQLLSFMQ